MGWEGRKEEQGRVQAVVVISPTARLWAVWLRVSWFLLGFVTWHRRGRYLVNRGKLQELSFINVAHWSLATRVPRGFYRRGSRRLKHPYLIFQTNFNDDLDAYVDAFALVLAWRMQALWHGIANFPGPIPVDAFLKYVKDNATPVQHYYCANPAGSARIIDDAFELTRVHDRLRAAEPQMSDSQFEQAWQCFVNDNQRLL